MSNSSVSQQGTGLTSGMSYIISVWYACHYVDNGADIYCEFRVFFGGHSLYKASALSSAGIYQLISSNVRASDMSSGNEGCYGAAIDDV